VSQQRDSDDVPHCRILSSDKAEWWLIPAALCRWRHCFLADQLWFMTCIREEDYNFLNTNCTVLTFCIVCCDWQGYYEACLCVVTDRDITKPVCVLWPTGVLRSLFVCCDWQGYYEACLCVLTDRGITKPVRCVLWWGDNLRGDLSSLAGQQRSSRAGRQGRRRQVSATVLHVVRWNVSELMATGWTLRTLRSRHSVM